MYHSKWVPNFSDIANPLFEAKLKEDGCFPLSAECQKSVEALKLSVLKATLHIPAAGIPFVLETDASAVAVSGILYQDGKPVSFYSHRLSEVEKRWSAVEQEAYAIFWSVQRCRDFLLPEPFEIITDQRAVSFLFGPRSSNTIKNQKIQRWQIELSPFNFKITHRPGKLNCAADALSRLSASKLSLTPEIVHIYHCDLGHPGVDRLTQFLRTTFVNVTGVKKLAKTITENCATCHEVKPRKHTPNPATLIKEDAEPWDMFSIDFAGPKTVDSEYRYFLSVIDAGSRFPFVFPCKTATADVAITHLRSIFSIFGAPAQLHSDRGSTFECAEFQNFLTSWGVHKTRTTPYHPQGNGQVEKLNGTFWRAVTAVSMERTNSREVGVFRRRDAQLVTLARKCRSYSTRSTVFLAKEGTALATTNPTKTGCRSKKLPPNSSVATARFVGSI